MYDHAFNPVVIAQESDPLRAQQRRREQYEAVSRAWAKRRREYLRRLGLLARPDGQTATAMGPWAVSG